MVDVESEHIDFHRKKCVYFGYKKIRWTKNPAIGTRFLYAKETCKISDRLNGFLVIIIDLKNAFKVSSIDYTE